MAYSYCRSVSLNNVDDHNNNGIHEGNLYQLYKQKDIPLSPFRTTPYLLSMIWRNVQETQLFYFETFPVECRECQTVNKEGLWVESYFFCKPCSCKIWNYIRDTID